MTCAMPNDNFQIVSAVAAAAPTQNVEAQLVEMMVPLYSYGCGKKIKNTLISNLKGIYSVNVDYNQQKVTVWGICNKYEVLKTVRSKRKAACFWNNSQGQQQKKQQQPNCYCIDDDHDDINPLFSRSDISLLSSISTKCRGNNNSLISHKKHFCSLSLKLACKKVFTNFTARSYSFPRI